MEKKYIMDEKILLKKYSNRRLYDTHQSRYVTLEELTHMIKSGKQVSIVDATTKEDVTAFVLTQIILEEARKNNFLLPVSVLHLIIRHGEDSLGGFFDKYFQKTIQNYLETQKAFDDQFNKWLEVGADMHKRVPGMMNAPAAMENFWQLFMPADWKKTDDDQEKESRQDESHGGRQ
jgi:polyhydroxyalkanoate synthesis repressor PhaR